MKRTDKITTMHTREEIKRKTKKERKRDKKREKREKRGQFTFDWKVFQKIEARRPLPWITNLSRLASATWSGARKL